MNSCIRVARQLAVTGLGVVALVLSARAQVQNPIEQVPLYPGAAAPPESEELPSPQLGMTLDSSRLYVVPASIEAVVRFYQQRLSAREVDAQEFEAALERADAEPLGAVLTLTWHDFTSPAVAALKSAVTSRPPYRSGHWLNGARFVWSQRQQKGDVATFGISVVDGMDVRRPKEPRTVLQIAAGISGGHAAEMEQAGAAEEGHAVAGAAAAGAPLPLTEPSPAQLGVPRYPGARFDGTMSAALSSGGDRYFVYTTADLPETVAAFYERETGKKGIRSEAGWLIAVKGSGLFPELGVAIQPNAGTYPPGVKTMITVRRGGQR